MKRTAKLFSLVLALLLMTASFSAYAEMPITTEDIKLSFYVTLDGKASVSLSSLEENLTMQYYEELSGIDIEWFHPSSASTPKESMNLLFASGELPDIIFDAFYAMNNIDALIEDGQILDLKDLIYEYCPNFVALTEEHPEILKQITTANGHIGYLPGLRLDDTTRYYESFIVRKDWLDKLGLEMPQTTEDWYKVLTAFKTGDPNGNGQPDEIPFVGNTNEEMNVTRLASLWGFNGCFYTANATSIRDGKVTFATDNPEFDAWVTEMAKWYAEGLIDPEYVSSDATTWKEKVLSDQGGMFYGKMNGGIGTLLGAYDYETGDPDFDLNPVPFATTADGKAYNFYGADIAGGGASITTKCEHVPEALKWLDYFYSKEGMYMQSFGIEGQTFEYDENGVPHYTDMITKEPGLSLVQAIAKYTVGGMGPQMVNTAAYWEAVMTTEQQKLVYPTVGSASADRRTPLILFYSVEESAQLASLMGDIETYYKENLQSFIMGKKPLEELGAFKEELHKSLRLDEAMAIMQTAYDRYLSA